MLLCYLFLCFAFLVRCFSYDTNWSNALQYDKNILKDYNYSEIESRVDDVLDNTGVATVDNQQTSIEKNKLKSTDTDEHSSVAKRSLGPTGLKFVRAALITAGIIHGVSLAITSARIVFDFIYSNHKCCGICCPSICSDYKSYLTVRNRVLTLYTAIDNEYLAVENSETFLFGLTTANTFLYDSMQEINDHAKSLALTIDPDLDRKLENATQQLVSRLGGKITKNYTLVQPEVDNIVTQVFTEFTRAASFFSDYILIYWVMNKLQTWEQRNIVKTRTRSQAVVAHVDPTAAQRAKYFIQNNYKRAGTSIVFAGTTAMSVYASVQDILYISKVVENCNTLKTTMAGVLTTINDQETKAKELRARIADLQANVTTQYNDLKESLYSSNFTAFTSELIKMATNMSSTSPTLAQAIKNINNFNAMIIGAGKSDAEKLVKNLTTTFKVIAKKFQCVTRQANLLNFATGECKIGSQTNDNLYAILQTEEVAINKECTENKLINRTTFDNWLQAKMRLYNAQSDCVLNDETKKALVCVNWLNGMINAQNAAKENLTTAQVLYFIETSICPPAQVTSSISLSICAKKNDKHTLAQVSQLYAKYNQTQVSSAYSSCAFSSTNQQLVCFEKDDGIALITIQAIYSMFQSSVVEGAYNACPAIELSRSITSYVCRKKTGGELVTSAHFDAFRDIYGTVAVQSAYDKCASTTGKDAPENHHRRHKEGDNLYKKGDVEEDVDDEGEDDEGNDRTDKVIYPELNEIDMYK
ncbi:uncharacterized protein LOC130625323 [Hydractinia symbiolongicarpus]|uniref:uncharacterized protein LOC130625323 n=1 Tax=Hydractinia symbiolongicarpus TaxID=13093 RepID=UPI00254CF216|nr:uncharacterized protein LOC130625323 [Hydractinia symbiolongicarpus]